MTSCKASIGYRGISFSHSQLNTKLIEQVNIQGTRNIIEGTWVQGLSCCHGYMLLFTACIATDTSHLVYTSTYNVVFGGQEIRNGGPSLPYLRPDQHVDHYSRTKCIAEQEVRGANGRSLVGGGTLRTCALRCAGIYGEGEQRHLPRIVVSQQV